MAAQSASAWRAQAGKKRGLVRVGENTDNCVDAVIHSKWAKLEILEQVFEKEMEGHLLHDVGLSRSINLSDPHGGESQRHRLTSKSNPCYYCIRPNRLFVLMSAPRVAWTRSARTAGCQVGSCCGQTVEVA